MDSLPPIKGGVSLSGLPGSQSSLQLLFASLQLALAKTNKEKTMTYMDSIQAEQVKTKQVASFISEARDCQVQAKETNRQSSPMSAEMKQFFDDNQLSLSSSQDRAMLEQEIARVESQTADQLRAIAYDTKAATMARQEDIMYSESEWKHNIESLEKYMETLGTDTQQKMVYIQDFMGQYNSYLTGADSAIKKSAETLANLARLK